MKKMKSAREVSSDETVHEARNFEMFNENMGSANDVKSQSFDRDTCEQIKASAGKCHFGALCMSCHMNPRRSVGRGLSLFAEQVNSSRLGACVPNGPRTSALTAEMMGPRRLGPTRRTSQCLARHARQEGRGVLGVG